MLTPGPSLVIGELAIHGLADAHTRPGSHAEGVQHPSAHNVERGARTGAEASLHDRGEMDVGADVESNTEFTAQLVSDTSEIERTPDRDRRRVLTEDGEAPVPHELDNSAAAGLDQRRRPPVEAMDQLGELNRRQRPDRPA